MSECQEMRRTTPAGVPTCATMVSAWIAEADWRSRLHSLVKLEEHIRSALPERDVWMISGPAAAHMSPDTIRGKDSAQVGAFCSRLRGHTRLGRNIFAPSPAAQGFHVREGFIETDRHMQESPEACKEVEMEW